MNRLSGILNMPEIQVLLEIMRLSSLETYSHSLSVATITNKMLEETGYSEDEKVEIVKGALLHDIGKIFIPFNLTQLPQSLSPQEYNIIKIHTSVSYEIVKSVFSKTVQNICLYHHERPNGSGYLEKINIPNEALLVQVADIYDALTSERSYKKGYETEEALKIIRNESEQGLLNSEYVSILETIV